MEIPESGASAFLADSVTAAAGRVSVYVRVYLRVSAANLFFSEQVIA